MINANLNPQVIVSQIPTSLDLRNLYKGIIKQMYCYFSSCNTLLVWKQFIWEEK